MSPDAARAAAAAALPDRIAFVGLGLIGGSIALALRAAGYGGRLVAWTPSGRGPNEAQRRGTIDGASPTSEAAIDGAGLVILAGPPLAILEDLSRASWHRSLGGEATLTDVASTKARIGAAADASGLQFVGGHPMAGRESTGFESATADLFAERPWVVVPGRHAAQGEVARVEALAVAVGARPIHLAAGEHDAAVAAISHVPLVLAAALVEAVAVAPGSGEGWGRARELAASGWRDMSRLAKGDPEMGAGILATNAAPTAQGLRLVRDAIDAWIEQLESGGPDGDAIRGRLEAARAALDAPTR